MCPSSDSHVSIGGDVEVKVEVDVTQKRQFDLTGASHIGYKPSSVPIGLRNPIPSAPVPGITSIVLPIAYSGLPVIRPVSRFMVNRIEVLNPPPSGLSPRPRWPAFRPSPRRQECLGNSTVRWMDPVPRGHVFRAPRSRRPHLRHT